MLLNYLGCAKFVSFPQGLKNITVFICTAIVCVVCFIPPHRCHSTWDSYYLPIDFNENNRSNSHSGKVHSQILYWSIEFCWDVAVFSLEGWERKNSIHAYPVYYRKELRGMGFCGLEILLSLLMDKISTIILVFKDENFQNPVRCIRD